MAQRVLLVDDDMTVLKSLAEALGDFSMEVTTAESGEAALRKLAEGVEFWRVGDDGAAGSFSSNAGRRVLLARINSKLPPPIVE